MRFLYDYTARIKYQVFLKAVTKTIIKKTEILSNPCAIKSLRSPRIETEWTKRLTLNLFVRELTAQNIFYV